MFTIYLRALFSLWDLCLSICTVLLVLLQLEIEFLMGVVIRF